VALALVAKSKFSPGLAATEDVVVDAIRVGVRSRRACKAETTRRTFGPRLSDQNGPRVERAWEKSAATLGSAEMVGGSRKGVLRTVAYR
jgi:hypothetical protein